MPSFFFFFLRKKIIVYAFKNLGLQKTKAAFNQTHAENAAVDERAHVFYNVCALQRDSKRRVSSLQGRRSFWALEKGFKLAANLVATVEYSSFFLKRSFVLDSVEHPSPGVGRPLRPACTVLKRFGVQQQQQQQLV